MAEPEIVHPPGISADDASVAMSSNRTEMSLERTALSSDRTLMSVVRTSLSLIGFGFTIFQFFHTLNRQFIPNGLPGNSPRHFASALIFLGIGLLVLGILNHMQETRRRRARRHELLELGLIRATGSTKPSSTMVIAILLLVVGILAVARVAFRTGPF